MTMKRLTIGLLAALATALLLAAWGGGAGAQGMPGPSVVIGGDGARILCLSNQITQVVQVTAYAVDIVCAPTTSAGAIPPHYVTLVAPSKARMACGKGGAPMNRGVLRERRIRADMIDLDCR